MSCGIGKDEEVDRCHLSNHDAETHVLPTQTRKLSENLCGSNVRSKHPDEDYDCYPAKTMGDSAFVSATDLCNRERSLSIHHDFLDPGKLVHHGRIYDTLYGRNGEHEQSALPSLRDIGRVVSRNHALNESSNEKGPASSASLP